MNKQQANKRPSKVKAKPEPAKASMPDSHTMVSRRIAYIDVVGIIWMPEVTCAQTIPLTNYDLDNIDDFTREAFALWLGSHAGDFQQVIDFSVRIGSETLPWTNEDNELTFNDCMH